MVFFRKSLNSFRTFTPKPTAIEKANLAYAGLKVRSCKTLTPYTRLAARKSRRDSYWSY